MEEDQDGGSALHRGSSSEAFRKAWLEELTGAWLQESKASALPTRRSSARLRPPDLQRFLVLSAARWAGVAVVSKAPRVSFSARTLVFEQHLTGGAVGCFLS